MIQLHWRDINENSRAINIYNALQNRVILTIALFHYPVILLIALFCCSISCYLIATSHPKIFVFNNFLWQKCLSRDYTLVTWSKKGHMTLRLEASHGKSAFRLARSSWVFWKCRYNLLNLLRDLTWPSHWEVMRIYGWELLAASHLSEKFGGHCGSGNRMFLICHVTSRDHMLKWLCEFVGGSPSQWISILPYLVAICLVQVEQTCDFSGFYRNSGFLNFFHQKINFWDSRINEEKIGKGTYYLHLFC